jgi:PAS domain S-box-containing protein
MSSSLFLVLSGILVVAALVSAVLSRARGGSWVAATVVALAGILALRSFADVIAGSGPFSADSLAAQLAAIVSLVFVPMIAVQYLRESLAAAPAPEFRRIRDDERDDIVALDEVDPARIEFTPTPAGAALASAEARLQQAQAHFRDFAESSRAGLWIQDARGGDLVYVSPAFERIWGCDADSLYEASNRRVEAIHAEDRARFATALAHALAGRELVEEYRVRRPDGSVLWVWDRAVPVRDAMGRVLRVVGMAEDITQRKGIEEVNLFRANFVANMSHEVRTPLNIMIGYLEFLLDGTFGELSQQQREITERVRNNAEELLDLMSASLDLSRLDNRTIPLAIETIDVGDLVDEVAGDISKLLSGPVQMRTELATDLPLLHSDRQKVKMVLKNLLSNAVKFTRAGEIVASARPLGDGIELEVRDTGLGIGADTLPRIFEPFRQGSAGKAEKSGVGLGLYIVRRLVDILEGRISVESTIGQGSAFRVLLPQVLSPERESDADEESDERAYA